MPPAPEAGCRDFKPAGAAGRGCSLRLSHRAPATEPASGPGLRRSTPAGGGRYCTADRRRGRYGLARGRRAAAIAGVSDLPGGRNARGSTRADRHTAQRRGQGEPVFPSWLQSRPRHRYRHHTRRHAGQLAHPRTWPRLFRSQFHDPGAGAANRLQSSPTISTRKISEQRLVDQRNVHAGCLARQQSNSRTRGERRAGQPLRHHRTDRRGQSPALHRFRTICRHRRPAPDQGQRLAIGDSLTLFNNFDFNVLFPPPIGVQFQQSERRKIIDGSASYTAFGSCSGGPPPAPSASIPASTTSI
jgi:hypothetical protein